ncbi:MAG: YidC/Oxa1 family membrane protein insertase [Eubacteriales bacterium]|nr:YidC/Oxa1 family membrane protein insertase [Eubacteriales bacterium]MDD3571837.1 YidC/Oxa1 family membrane protein insertase [Eubacteriales bacterium]MDD4134862.1 YidC/Oxa1 family membrane protein insertase [Eubacteriales bacterium]NLO12783.1 YidC/Oxa1 family membrane protein insertase [Clostridiales bacterium]
MAAITNVLLAVIEWIYTIVHNHGWSIVIFTILIRLVLVPLDVQSRKGMRKMAKIQPQINALQKKYANDKAKLQQKQSELMRKEHYSPLSGCLPMLIQMPILFAMFGAMRNVANERVVEQVFTFLQGETPIYESWLWVKNIFMADSLFASIAPDPNTIQAITSDVWQNAYASLSQGQIGMILENIQATVPTFAGVLDFSSGESLKAVLPDILTAMRAMPTYVAQIQPMPGWANINFFLFSVTIYQIFNGLLILPVMAGASQLLMTKINPQMSGQPQTQAAGASGAQSPGMGNFMKYFFPLFSVYICLTSNAGFALYWVTSNLVATGMTFLINQYFDRKEQRASGVIHQEGTIK